MTDESDRSELFFDLQRLLQEHLTVEVSKEYPYNPFGEPEEKETTVKVYFDGNLVAEGSD